MGRKKLFEVDVPIDKTMDVPKVYTTYRQIHFNRHFYYTHGDFVIFLNLLVVAKDMKRPIINSIAAWGVVFSITFSWHERLDPQDQFEPNVSPERRFQKTPGTGDAWDIILHNDIANGWYIY